MKVTNFSLIVVFEMRKTYWSQKALLYLMPALKGKRNQLTTKEANQSRFMTKIRWSVKSGHEIIKQKYRLLDHIIDNKLLPMLGCILKLQHFCPSFRRNCKENESSVTCRKYFG